MRMHFLLQKLTTSQFMQSMVKSVHVTMQGMDGRKISTVEQMGLSSNGWQIKPYLKSRKKYSEIKNF